MAIATNPKIITCVVCGLDNHYPAPEMGGKTATMVRTDESLGRGICDSITCEYRLKNWDSGNKEFDYKDNYEVGI